MLILVNLPFTLKPTKKTWSTHNDCRSCPNPKNNISNHPFLAAYCLLDDLGYINNPQEQAMGFQHRAALHLTSHRAPAKLLSPPLWSCVPPDNGGFLVGHQPINRYSKVRHSGIPRVDLSIILISSYHMEWPWNEVFHQSKQIHRMWTCTAWVLQVGGHHGPPCGQICDATLPAEHIHISISKSISIYIYLYIYIYIFPLNYFCFIGLE